MKDLDRTARIVFLCTGAAIVCFFIAILLSWTDDAACPDGTRPETVKNEDAGTSGVPERICVSDLK